MTNKLAIYTDLKVPYYLKILYKQLLFGYLSSFAAHPTIDCNNILIKVQFINIVAVSDSETHSERFA